MVKGTMPEKLASMLLCILILTLFSATAYAADPGLEFVAKETELAKKTQNPVADLISIPFQYNINFGYGPRNNTQSILNIQPVIPFNINREWNVITRTIIPVLDQPVPDRKIGLGDVQVSLFLSPAIPGKFIWGAGPALQFPTATGNALGQGKWAAGPTAVGLFMNGPWVLGILANNLWSYADESDRPEVNQFLAQPFINYNLPKGWYISISPAITANWKADNASDQWFVPLGGGVGKVSMIGKLPLNGSLAFYQNVVKPEAGPDWNIRLQIGILLPKGKD
ncbi:MAG TPA: hypothetical protein PKM26_08905 [Syntrophorhabdaceae bacterium]|nr:hypothetical protein [Syntrophorhabdaceae bacterium]